MHERACRSLMQSSTRGSVNYPLIRPVVACCKSCHTDARTVAQNIIFTTSRFISESKATAVLHGMDRRVLSGHHVECYFTDVNDGFVMYNAYLTRLCATLSGWGDESDDDKVERYDEE